MCVELQTYYTANYKEYYDLRVYSVSYRAYYVESSMGFWACV
jgi:hypothetical protein